MVSARTGEAEATAAVQSISNEKTEEANRAREQQRKDEREKVKEEREWAAREEDRKYARDREDARQARAREQEDARQAREVEHSKRTSESTNATVTAMKAMADVFKKSPPDVYEAAVKVLGGLFDKGHLTQKAHDAAVAKAYDTMMASI